MTIMKSLIAASALAIGLAAALPAAANSIEEDDVEKGKVTLAADSGYVFQTAPTRFAGRFIRVPDAEDVANYQQARAEALAEEQEDFEDDIRRWERAVQRARRNGRDEPERPVMATEETFVFRDIDSYLTVDFGPAYSYSRDEETDGYAYLTQMKPGRYIWYGPVAWAQSQGYMGVCYCMGSVQFDVAAGAVTDLGNFLFAGPDFAAQVTAPVPTVRHDSGFSGYTIGIPGQVEAAVQLTYGLPASLAGWPVVQPEFYASGKMNNTYGVMVSRIAPVEGVISYQRDRVIDERTGQPIERARLQDLVNSADTASQMP